MDHEFKEGIGGRAPKREWVLRGALYCRVGPMDKASGVIHATANFCSAQCSTQHERDRMEVGR